MFVKFYVNPKDMNNNNTDFDLDDTPTTTTTTPPPTDLRSYVPTVTNAMKWWLAIFLGILFFLIAFPGTYNVTNAVWTSVGLPSYMNAPGAPNAWGVLIHAIIFALIIRLILW